MTFENVIEKLGNYNTGSFIRCGWQSDIGNARSRKEGVVITKQSEATVRLGIKYSNIKAVKEARAAKPEGEEKPHKIWFRHLEDVPAIIEHLEHTEKKYLCMYPISKGGNAKVKFFMNGKEVSKEFLMASGYVNPSEWNKSETNMFSIPLENIRFIGREVA